MKRWLPILLLIGMLTGCGSQSSVEKALNLRSLLLNGNGCTFRTEITADYGDKVYTFVMDNTVDKDGNLSFKVISPDSIAGITGKIENEKGTLTFDEEILAFSLLTDDQISPVSAPWLFMKTLRSGYISACENGEFGTRIQMNDSYDEDALQVDIWTDPDNIPIRAEILFRGQRIITLDVENFTIL